MTPRHVAVVPDGNRRWARARGLTPSDGHRVGIRGVGPVAEAAWAAGVEVFTFWWGSPSNLLNRDRDEVAVITGCLRDWLEDEGASLVSRAGAAFEVHGRWRSLCPDIEPGVAAIRGAAGVGARRLVLLMGYDGREEIRAAAQALGGAGESLADFGRATWTGGLPPVDLLIRTGGEPHNSAGFMAWSAADAQLAFPQVLWPAFTPELLAGILRTYGVTGRRFGR